jgi:hypothetical protein
MGHHLTSIGQDCEHHLGMTMRAFWTLSEWLMDILIFVV